MKEKEIENALKIKISLYVESILYIILIIFIIFLNIYGDIYVRTIPLLFFLGMAGKMVYDRPIITSIFSLITSAVFLFIHGNYTLSETTIFCLYMTSIVILGEINGALILKIYDHNKKSKVLTNSRKIIVILFMLIITFFSFWLHSYVSGNIFEYSYKKSKLKEYIVQKYSEKLDEFRIDDSLSQYHKDTYSYYLINDTNEKYEFLISKDGKITDGYKNKIIEENNNIISNKFQSFMDEREFSKKYIDYSFNIKYVDLDSYFDVKITILKNVSEESSDIKNFAEELTRVFDELKSFSEYSKISYATVALISSSTNDNLLSIVETNIYKEDFESDIENIYSLLTKDI